MRSASVLLVPKRCVLLTLQVCNNEATCTCDPTWAGTDCSMADPPKKPEPTKEGPKGRFSPPFLLTYESYLLSPLVTMLRVVLSAVIIAAFNIFLV